MRDMVEVGWGRNKLGANISVHVSQAPLFDFESKSIRATVRRKEEEETSELAGSSCCSKEYKREQDQGLVHMTREKFENAASVLRHETGAFRKRS